MKPILLILLIASCTCIFKFNLNEPNKYGTGTIIKTACNKDTEIDFFFNSKTMLKCSGSTCSLTKSDSSTMKFLDVKGNDLDLMLNYASLTGDVLTENFGSMAPAHYFTFTFKTSDNAKVVDIIVPIVFQQSIQAADIYNLDKVNDGTFSTLKTLSVTSLGNGLALDAFNYLNELDFCSFYTVANTNATETVLLSSTILNLPNDLVSITASSNINLVPDYKATGNKLCYGALETSKMFQTHLRESWPLWTAWFGILLFWLYYLLAEPSRITVYDQKFNNNKMTCWGFYSLHYLAHEEFFTVLSREGLMLFNFSLQGMILAAVYSTLGDNPKKNPDYTIIPWSSAIAFVATLPVPFFFGGVFLTPLYKNTLQKYRIIKKSKTTTMKKEQEQEKIYEAELDKKEEKLYSLIYWYYILIFAGFICFWVASIHMMQQLHREYYYLQRIWLASLGIVFVLEHLIYDPIFSALLGNKQCYRIRGYFYNFELGQEFKEIEE